MSQAGHNLLYLLVRYEKSKTYTFIGSTANFSERLREHNNNGSIWLPVLALKLPATRTVSVKTLRERWKRSARGLDSRVKYGFTLAKKNKATAVFIHDIDTPILKFLNQLHPQGNEPRAVDASFWEQF